MELSSIPARVLDAVRERGHSDEEIERMCPETLFTEFCEWEGLINWGGTLWRMAHQLNDGEG